MYMWNSIEPENNVLHILTLPFLKWCLLWIGFQGKNCEENVDDCPGNLCQNGGTCVDGVNAYRCKCPPNFTGNFCEQDVDECATRWENWLEISPLRFHVIK